MPKDIQFPESEPRYVFEWDCLAFRALADDKPIECLVTGELLMQRFGAQEFTEDAFREAFARHWDDIQTIARQHIEMGWVGSDSRIILTTRFTRLKADVSGQLEGWPAGRTLVNRAHPVLLELIGPSAGEVHVEWSRTEDEQGRASVTLRIIDPSLREAVSAAFDSKEWDDSLSWLRVKLATCWGAILQLRSRNLVIRLG